MLVCRHNEEEMLEERSEIRGRGRCDLKKAHSVDTKPYASLFLSGTY